jgi:pimeloyl-ACP methyl ester carboxylesterase
LRGHDGSSACQIILRLSVREAPSEKSVALAAQPAITVPTITLDGDADGVVAATDGKSMTAKFASERQHRVSPNVGHNLPQENPTAFADAVWELASKKRYTIPPQIGSSPGF